MFLSGLHLRGNWEKGRFGGRCLGGYARYPFHWGSKICNSASTVGFGIDGLGGVSYKCWECHIVKSSQPMKWVTLITPVKNPQK